MRLIRRRIQPCLDHRFRLKLTRRGHTVRRLLVLLDMVPTRKAVVPSVVLMRGASLKIIRHYTAREVSGKNRHEPLVLKPHRSRFQLNRVDYGVHGGHSLLAREQIKVSFK